MEYVAEHFPRQVTVQRIGCKPFLAEPGRSITMTNEMHPHATEPEEFQRSAAELRPQGLQAIRCEKALAEETVAAIPVDAGGHGHTRRRRFMPPSKRSQGSTSLASWSRIRVELVGVFSDRDVLERVALEYDQVKDRPVQRTDDRRTPWCVYESDSAAAALSIMAVSGFRHVPVTNVDGTSRRHYQPAAGHRVPAKAYT